MTAHTTELRRTPLYSAHLELGGKMVPFAGWEMPVQYPTGIIAEHTAVRSAGGLFDVSHMGEFEVTGPDAVAALNRITCNDVAALADGRAHYSAFLNEKGGVVDDIIVYRYSPQRFLICVNAGNTAIDYAWCKSKLTGEVVLKDRSAEFGQIAIQGPQAVKLCARLAKGVDLLTLPTFSFAEVTVQGVPVIAARTGYTGEDGYEFFIPWAKTSEIWSLLVKEGKGVGCIPAGLGARDSLRLEAALPLHGHELSQEISALTSGIGWVVKFAKESFIGKEALLREKEKGLSQKLVGLVIEGGGIVREGVVLVSSSGTTIGKTTSGTKTPSLEKPIALAFVDSAHAVPETMVKAKVRDKLVDCRIVKPPFYKRIREESKR